MPNHSKTRLADSAFAILKTARETIIGDDHPHATQVLQRERMHLAQSQHTADFANLILERLAHRTPSRLDERKKDRDDLLALFHLVASKATQDATERKIKRDLTAMIHFMKELREQGLRVAPQFNAACRSLVELAKIHNLTAELPPDMRPKQQPVQRRRMPSAAS